MSTVGGKTWGQPMELFTYKATQRFWSRVMVGLPSDCWEWSGSRRSDGYGQVYIGGKHRATHRLSFYLSNLFWPPVVRHRCDNPRCCNPHHLEAGTQSENMQDVVARGRHYYANRTHCPYGHEYTPDNTYLRPSGGRECRTCRKERPKRDKK